MDSSPSQKGRSLRRLVIVLTVLGLVLAMAAPMALAKSKQDRSNRTRTTSTTTTSPTTSTSTTLAIIEDASLETVYVESASVADLEPTYDPATDRGSLYNVGRMISLATKAKGSKHLPSGAGVQVALIDTGIVDVPGLRNSNVIIGPDFSLDYPNEALRGRDGYGHGTHLAGILVGTDEAWLDGDRERAPGRGLGIAPDAELVSIKVGAADGAVDVTQVIAAINWVIEHGNDPGYDIRVITLAFGTDTLQPYLSDPLAYAVERAWKAGIVVVVAGGNNGTDAWVLRNPATDPFVIAVGAAEGVIEQAKQATELDVTDFSNGGNIFRGVDLVAPGRSVVSLRVPGSFSDQFNEAGRVGEYLVRASGTSQAAAVVAGAAALLLEERPELTPDQVKGLLTAGARPIADDERVEGAGLIDVASSLSLATPTDGQKLWPASGTGSIEYARGMVRVAFEGEQLVGEVDIFGNSWTASRWTEDSWSQDAWIATSWTGHSWSGHSWTGHSWSGDSWTGHSWSGDSWSGHSWTDQTWTGHSWSGHSWSGHSWTGHSWSGHGWTDLGWH